jgi:SAM-dependent methyltransferase
MGRFDSTAAAYAAYREPYPEAFFAEAAARLGLSGREGLIDLGTGPGLLALGFAPFVARVVGVDPEPAMVAAARASGLQVVEGRAEDVDLGVFDLVTIGRALHWMEREPTLAALDRMLAQGGRIFVCASRNSKETPWRAAFDEVTQRYSEGGEARNHRAHQHFFDDSPFVAAGEVAVEHRQRISVDALVERALTRSTTSPAVLGDRVGAFRADMRQALAPFFPEGEGEEIIEARGRIFERPR